MKDLAYAWRGFRRAPGLAITVVSVLALGIGASTAVFTVVNGVLLKPLPYPHEARLIRVWETNAREGVSSSSISPGNFADWRARSMTTDGWAVYYARERTLTGTSDPERIRVASVSPALFDVLGVQPLIGRTFAREDQAGSTPVREMVISYEMWRGRFGGDPAILSRQLFFEARPEGTPIVGVMPPGFGFPDHTQVWSPEIVRPGGGSAYRAQRYHQAIARLKPGVDVRAAQTELDTIQARLSAEHPEINAGWGIRVEDLRAATVGSYRATLLALLASVGCLLLIGCVNVANAWLARVLTRRPELAVRIALGAGPGRLVRQVLIESAVLGLGGAAAGALVSIALVQVIVTLLPPDLPRLDEIAIDLRVLAFGIAVSLASAVLVGVWPALRASRVDVREGLAQRGGAPDHRSARDTLIAIEVALTLVLLIGAGLCFRTVAHLRQVDLGYRTGHVLAAEVSVPVLKFGAGNRRPWYQLGQFYQRILEEAGRVPGVIDAAGSTRSLLAGEGTEDFVWALPGDGREFRRPASAADRLSAAHNVVTPNYFRVLGITLLRGRAFTAGDRVSERALTDPQAPAEPRVAIVNETLARRLWPGRDPIGQRMADESYQHVLEVVGVVADVRDARIAAEAQPQMYEPYLQNPPIGLTLLLATSVPPAAVAPDLRARLRSVDRDLVFGGVAPLDTIAARAIASPRLILALVASFAFLAVALAVVGLYGVMSYWVAQQWREIGIRAAIGAGRPALVALVLLGGMRPVAAGLIAGVVLAIAMGRLIRGLLYGVAPADPLTLAAAIALFTGVAAVACLIPARRAAKIDPVVALRTD